jgi:hypothetical protein
MTAQHLGHLEHPQKVAARRAALRARQLYPGAIRHPSSHGSV